MIPFLRELKLELTMNKKLSRKTLNKIIYTREREPLLDGEVLLDLF